MMTYPTTPPPRGPATRRPGPLYNGVLTVAARCSVCDLDLSTHDSGDGPAVFVILIMGILVVPLALWLEVSMTPPIWVNLVVWPPVILALAMLLLRLMKAILVAIHFKKLRHEYNE